MNGYTHMSKFNLAVIVGSLRKDSMNLKLGKALAKQGRDAFNATFLNIGDLPLYNQDLEANFPDVVTRFKNDIAKADAVLFVTPEYNRGVPGPLKNAIDWASRPSGKNSFAGKPAALCGATPGAIGTACAQSSLRHTLVILDMALMGQPELYLQFSEGLIDSEGNVSNERTQQFLQKFVDRFIAWVGRHAGDGATKAA